jgi:energy-coupling factor transporter ATP-binding protein EcfA2
MPTTRIKKIKINKFRALNEVEIEVGTNITLICGKNGTSKSSILGIAAQAFSFDSDLIKKEKLSYKTITGAPYKSFPSEHFRFSERFDTTGSMDVEFEIFDGYSEQTTTPSLKLYKYSDRAKPRPIIRGNDTVPGRNKSRNLTHPVIYLSLGRLLPIPLRDYSVVDRAYLNAKKSEFLKLSNRLLNKSTDELTSTSGSIDSAVAHGSNYDQDSVSAGEDNAGQIILAILSFKKLKDEYPDYKGGLLLIDEADAGLFPAAQISLIEILQQQCQDLNIQVVITSHSPTMIEKVFDLSQKYRHRHKTIYLTDTYGKIEQRSDVGWGDIFADLMIDTVEVDEGVSLPKINIYFEDAEGADFFDKIINAKALRVLINPMRQVSLGCSNYKQLVSKKIPEFSKKSIIVLDADVTGAEALASIILLPGTLPPDQIIFEYLYNLDAADELWRNKGRFTRDVFIRISRDIIERLDLKSQPIDLVRSIAAYQRINNARGNKEPERLRELFKDFYKNDRVQKLIKLPKVHSPLKRWIFENKDDCKKFKNDFIILLQRTLAEGYGVDKGKLAFLDDLLT